MNVAVNEVSCTICIIPLFLTNLKLALMKIEKKKRY